MTVNRSSNAGSTGAHRAWSAAAPCTSTSGGPAPLRQHAMDVPSAETTLWTIGASLCHPTRSALSVTACP